MNDQDRIAELANQCVQCGLCLPHCPTYVDKHEEGHSPRGRISLLAALNANTLKLDDELRHRFDPCQGCGRCEIVCPSNVQYLQLLNLAQTKLLIGL
jgi:glycolate oxidase iron-sulfur subunit